MKEKLANLWFRIAHNPKTTVGGVSITALLTAVWYQVMQQAHCDFSQIQWAGIVTSTVMPLVMGAFATDANKTVPQ